MVDPRESWQVDVKGEIYNTEFAELVNWIAEGSLSESDKVRRGELRWLDAGRVPLLREFFEANVNGTEPPFVESPSESISEDTVIELSQNDIQGTVEEFQSPVGEMIAQGDDADTFDVSHDDQEYCSIHTGTASDYVCEGCARSFCKECPKGYGGAVTICPNCGAMCKPITEFDTERGRQLRYQKDISEGFGFNDFGKALSYPFQFRTSLFVGGLLFAFLTLGRMAGSSGSIVLIVSALICLMLANALTFAVLANTIDNFSQGLVDQNFMPDFDDFSLWDDVVHPFFLSLGVYISSFGLFLVLVIGGIWFSWSSFTTSATNSDNQGIAAPTVKESGQSVEHIKQLLAKYKKQNEERTGLPLGQDGLTATQKGVMNDEAEFMRLNDLANNHRKSQLQGVIGKTAENAAAENQARFFRFLKFGGIFIIFALIALLWGLFYFPAACAVAGYTRSFAATINPVIGLDTIKHLGVDYVKILLMVFLMSIGSGLIGAILGLVLAPFILPKFGNIPAAFLGSFVTFYLSITFAVTLGYALYKNSDKLDLYRG